MHASSPSMQVHETFETSQVGSSSRAVLLRCSNGFLREISRIQLRTCRLICYFYMNWISYTHLTRMHWLWQMCIYEFISTHMRPFICGPNLDCFALNLIKWGNAHLNSFSKAVERGAGAWLRAVQLMEGIKGTNLEPSLPTNNVPCEWRHWW